MEKGSGLSRSLFFFPAIISASGCSHFHDGAPTSAKDLLAREGVRTARVFHADTPVVLRHSQMVHPVAGQPALAGLETRADSDLVRLRFENGHATEAPLAWRWLLEPDACQ